MTMKTIEEYISGFNIKIIILSVGLTGLLWIAFEVNHLSSNIETTRDKFLSSHKQDLKNSVQEIVSYSIYMKSQTRIRLKQVIKNRTIDAWKIADNIYRKNKDKLSPSQLEKITIEAIRNIRYNGTRGYYFAFKTNGVEVLFADRPELEGKNMLGMRDTKGNYVVRDMINIAVQKGQGFYEYTWTKPKATGKYFPKISYIKHFKPLDLVFGTGEYLDDIDKDIQREVIRRIVNTKRGAAGYYFVGTYKGVALSGPGKGRNMLHVTDRNGVKVVEELIKLAQKEGGYLTYEMPPLEDQRQSKKLSYVEGLPDWEWYIGSGIYIDELEELISKEVEKLPGTIFLYIMFIVLISTGAISIQVLRSRRLARQIKTEFDIFKDYLNKSARSLTKIDTSKVNIKEFSELAESANETTRQRIKSKKERETLEKQLLQAQKMDALGTISGGIAHDFNNILAPIFGYTALLTKNFEPGSKQAQQLSNISTCVARGRDLVNQILSFSKNQPLEKKPVSIKETLIDIHSLMQTTTPSHIKIELNIETENFIFADITQIHQIFINLVNNAIQAITPDEGEIKITGNDVIIDEHHHLKKILPAGAYVCLKVSDNGPGIPREIIHNIFDPFFTTKQKKSGTGLGLSVIHSIVGKHKGYIEAASIPDKETVFTIHFPVTYGKSSEPDYKTIPDTENAAGQGIILLIDDEELILSTTKEILELDGFEVLTVNNYTDALKLFEENSETIDLVISDMNLTGGSGDNLIAELNKKRTTQKIILWTGYTERLNENRIHELQINLILYKPVDIDNLRQHIKTLLVKDDHES